MKKLELRVEGVTCAGCAVDAASVLKNTEGIVDAEVNYPAETVSLTYQPGEIDEERISGLIRRLGFKIR